MRLLHALCGLLVVVASYALLRQVLPRRWALFATLLFGTSHAFFMISRFAMRENTAVLAEVVAFALLLWGLRNDDGLATFLGGIVAGLGFYVYTPSRIAFPLWVLFMIGVALLYRSRFPLRKVLVLGAIATAGVVLMAAPITIAESKIPPQDHNQSQETFFFYNEARNIQRGWVYANTQWEGYEKNVKFGLGTFNNNIQDHGWIYANPGHGFLDPLSGILLWLGVGVVGLGIWRRRDDEGAFLMLASFVALWLSFALLINKAPNYTRLLIMLPFVAYLVTQAVRWLAGRWRSVRHGPAAIVGAVLVIVVVSNLAIAWDFVQTGRESGETIGNTGRYVASHKDIPGEQFFISTPFVEGGNLGYFDFGPGEERLRLFTPNPAQVGGAIDPSLLTTFSQSPPFALFMTRAVWVPAAAYLAEQYPQGRLRNILPDGTRVVFEVP